MQMIMAEFRGKRAGFFRPKPVRKVGKVCPRCGKFGHVGTTTCDVKTLDDMRPLSTALPNAADHAQPKAVACGRLLGGRFTKSTNKNKKHNVLK